MGISNQFITQLFTHPHFKQSLYGLWKSFDSQTKQEKSFEENVGLNSVVEEISQLLEINFKTAFEQQCNHIYDSNRQILQELDQIKSQLKHSPTLKTQSSTAERDTNPKLQTSIFFQTDSQFDMKEIRKQFDDEVENKILINSFEIDQQERTYNDQEIEEKINASIEESICRIQLTLEEKFDKYSTKIEQRIEQLRKTIASVVEAMNQKEFWAHDLSKNNHGKYAFAKKQSKPHQTQRQNQFLSQKDTIQQHEKQNEIQIKNSQKQKEKQKTLPNPHLNSNKTIQSLNNSINLGRTKIRSLFGFKSGVGNKDNNQA